MTTEEYTPMTFEEIDGGLRATFHLDPYISDALRQARGKIEELIASGLIEILESEGHLAQHDREVAAKAWDEGFAVGAEAGGRWMENGGADDDDVNPYRIERGGE